jgi:hypothetical protein
MDEKAVQDVMVALAYLVAQVCSVGLAAAVYSADAVGLAFVLAASAVTADEESMASDSAVDFAASTDQNSTEMNRYYRTYYSMMNWKTTSCWKMTAISTFQIDQICLICLTGLTGPTGPTGSIGMNYLSSIDSSTDWTSAMGLASALVVVPALVLAWVWCPRE